MDKLSDWKDNTGTRPCRANDPVVVMLRSGDERAGFAKEFDWALPEERYLSTDILRWRKI